jgi:MFS family permease
VSAIGQGLAPTYPLLLASWVAFGLGAALVLTGSLAWISDLLPTAERATALGGTATVSGLAIIVGPIFGGLLATTLGLGAPFLIAGGIAFALTLFVYAIPAENSSRHASLSMRATLRATRDQPLVSGGLTLIALLGLTFGTINVIVPLQLDEQGLSPREIGLVFSVMAILFVVVSGAVARLGARVATLKMAIVASLAHAAIFVVPITNISASSLIAFMLLRAPIWAVAATIAYPLCADGAHRVGLGRGAIFGLLNLVWGTAAVAGPLLAGLVGDAGSVRTVYLLVMLAWVGASIVLIVTARKWSALANEIIA